MKLLILSHNPERPSFRQRIGIYRDILHGSGFDCQIVKLPARSVRRWSLFRKSREYDGVFLHKKCLNLYDAWFLRRYAKKIIYDFDDAVMYSPQRPDSNRTSHFRLFRRTMRMADMVIAGNSYLAEHAGKFCKNVHILPTGLDTGPYLRQSKSPADDKIRLVWIGSKSTLGYLKDIQPALEEIGKKYRHVVLRIICDDYFDIQNMAVEKCPWSLETEIPDLCGGDIGLAPLPDNRFTRGKCGFKILQYAAAGLPVVVSPVGVNAEYINNGKTGLAADSIDAWVKKLSILIEDKQAGMLMGSSARAMAMAFDTKVIGARLSAMLRDCIDSGG